MISIKRGASFRLALNFTDEEWASLFPVDLIVSQYKKGDMVADLEVIVDENTKCVFLRAETSEWEIGKGAFDVKLVRGGLITVVPELASIEVQVVKGVTE